LTVALEMRRAQTRPSTEDCRFRVWARGLTDEECARKLGMDRTTFGMWRRARRLPGNLADQAQPLDRERLARRWGWVMEWREWATKCAHNHFRHCCPKEKYLRFYPELESWTLDALIYCVAQYRGAFDEKKFRAYLNQRLWGEVFHNVVGDRRSRRERMEYTNIEEDQLHPPSRPGASDPLDQLLALDLLCAIRRKLSRTNWSLLETLTYNDPREIARWAHNQKTTFAGALQRRQRVLAYLLGVLRKEEAT